MSRRTRGKDQCWCTYERARHCSKIILRFISGNVNPLTNNPPPFQRLNFRIPDIMPIKGRGLLIKGLGYPTL